MAPLARSRPPSVDLAKCLVYLERVAIQVNIGEAKTQLSRLIERAIAGEEVIIARANTPIVHIVPIRPDRPKRRLGWLAGQLVVGEDFDDPLPELERLAHDTTIDP